MRSMRAPWARGQLTAQSIPAWAVWRSLWLPESSGGSWVGLCRSRPPFVVIDTDSCLGFSNRALWTSLSYQYRTFEGRPWMGSGFDLRNCVAARIFAAVGRSFNGRTRGSGPWNRGSNPCLPATYPIPKLDTFPAEKSGSQGVAGIRTPRAVSACASRPKNTARHEVRGA